MKRTAKAAGKGFVFLLEKMIDRSLLSSESAQTARISSMHSLNSAENLSAPYASSALIIWRFLSDPLS
ncbi:hypothetical protein ADK56_12040 [Streptomyces sp. MMG1522]|nr:hypothetical protein ADK33_11645 [Streptomyces griseus subsp. rhodochrous]KOU50909.1 hypothetical protein ADK56_12040 [Streptomyces sp. MMG1522]